MTVTAIYPAVVCVLGLLLWVLARAFKWSLDHIPAIMFACGLLVWLFALAGKAVQL